MAQRRPPPCAAGSTVTVTLEGQSLQHSNQVEHAHGVSYSLSCSSVNADYSGDLEVSCDASELKADTSTCIGIPCETTATVEVSVGWLNGTLAPSSQEAHGNTWTSNCYSINEEFSGDIALTCAGGTVSAVMACTQMEVGCQPGGQGRGDAVTVESYTQALQPSAPVQLGGQWSF
ncbi:unnamed protein product, partial [Durusdinium trenchii]